MTGALKHYSRRQLAAILEEDRVVWLDFPSSFRFLVEHWVEQESHRARPDLEHLVAYSVLKLAAASEPSGQEPGWRRAWTAPYVGGGGMSRRDSAAAVDPASIMVGRPTRQTEDRAR